MADYYVDSRATGANDGDIDAGTGPDENGIYQDAWQTIDAVEAGLPINGAHTVNFVAGSGPYTLTGPVDGLGNDKTINGNGCTIDGSADLNSSAYQWTQSAANPLEYYIEAAAGGDPSLNEVTCGTINGKFQEGSAEESQYTMGTVGSLENEFIGWGDNDSLGFNTVYARWDAGTPADIVIKVAQHTYVWDTNFINNTINDLTLLYGETAIVNHRSGSGTHTMNRCIMAYAGTATSGNGYANSAANDSVLNNCITFFGGHRGYVALLGTSGDITLNNCIDINSHLFAYTHASYTGTFIVRNCVGYLNPAGVIDTNAASFTFTESNNCWWPSFNSGTAALEYPDGSDNVWTTTAATDFPPSADTGIGTFAALESAGGVDPLFNKINLRNLDDCDFALQATSPIRAGGVAYWTSTAARPNDFVGEPYPDFSMSIGAYQSKDAPFHPFSL